MSGLQDGAVRKHGYRVGLVYPQRYIAYAAGGSLGLYRGLELALWFGVVGVVAPVLMFLVCAPLFLDIVPIEAWVAYYRFLFIGIVVCFGENMARISFEDAVSTPLVVAGFASCYVSQLAIVLTLGCLASVVSSFAVAVVAVSFPSLLRFLRCGSSATPRRVVLLHLASLCFSTTPCLLCVALYVLVVRQAWLQQWFTVAVALVLWISAPVVVRPLGSRLWAACSPTAAFAATCFWKLYCDVAFATFGLIVFERNLLSSIAFAGSGIVLLVVHALRGCTAVLNVAPRFALAASQSHRECRLSIFFDAFVCILARTMAYTLYMCMVSARLATGQAEWQPISQRPHLSSSSGGMLAVVSAQIFRTTHVSASDLGVSFACLVMTWSAFGVFCLRLPVLWRRESRPWLALDPCGSSTTGAVVAWALPEELPTASMDAVVCSVWGAASRTRGGGDSMACMSTDPSSRAGVLQQQLEMLSEFLRAYRTPAYFLMAFQLMITMGTVNSAEGLAGEATGQSCR